MALQIFSAILVLHVLDRNILYILNVYRLKRHFLNISFVLITKLLCNVLPVGVFKASVSKINFKK